MNSKSECSPFTFFVVLLHFHGSETFFLNIKINLLLNLCAINTDSLELK